MFKIDYSLDHTNKSKPFLVEGYDLGPSTRPILTAKIDNIYRAELDIYRYSQGFVIIIFLEGKLIAKSINSTRVFDLGQYKKDKDLRFDDVFIPVGSFFDDPKAYSKLFWNCNEQEGWEKILNLLNINL